MKKANKNIIIIVISLLLVAGVFYLINTQRKKNIYQPPQIDKIYQESDFPQSNFDATAKKEMVDKLNKDYKYLRDKVDYSVYDIWIDIGNRKLVLKDFDGAVEAWDYATRLDSNKNLAYANLANYYKSFAKDYQKADYYYNLVISKDSTGYFFDYQSYAELYIDYLPVDPYKVETIMLAGADKAVGPSKLEFYRYLYTFWQERDNKNKVEQYKAKVLEIDPNYQL